MKRILLVLAFFVAATFSRAELIPAARLVNWEPGHAEGSGVPGGIPTGRTMYVNAKTGELGAGGTYVGTLAVGDGTTDDTAAINAMIVAAAASGSDKYVYLPASSYKINAQILIYASNVTLRGAGVTTIIIPGSPRAFLVGQSGSATTSTTTVTDSSTLTAGSGSLTVGSTSGFTAGKLVFISPRNDPAVPVLATDGRENAVSHLAKITAVSSGTVFTFTPALKYDMGGGSVTVTVAQVDTAPTVASGVENLLVDGTAYGGLYSGVEFNNTYGCWVKDVMVDGVHNYPILFQATCRNEARRNWAKPRLGGGSSGGAVFLGYSTSALVEDNVLEYGLPIFQQDGNMANVISRNLGVGGVLNINHGPYNMYTLVEANAARGGIQSDGYFGGSRYDIIYNNYAQYVVLNRGSHDAVVVGNMITDPSTKATTELFGFPNISNLSYSGTVTPPTTIWSDFGMTGTLTTRSGDFSGTITLDTGFSLQPAGVGNDFVWLYWNDYANVLRVTRTTVSGSTVDFIESVTTGDVLPPEETPLNIGGGPLDFQEKDLGVEARMTRKGNRWGDNVFDDLGGDTLPDSLMYSSKPQWMTDAETELSTTFALKPFDPVTPVAASNSDIPAGLRYETLNPPDFSGAAINNLGTILSITLSKPTTFGAGGNTGFTITGGVTLTYSNSVGSVLYYTTSRQVTDEETFTISYTNPGNGVEDSNGNDLPDFTASAVTNGSQYAAGSYWVQALDLASANTTTNLSNVAAIIQPITIPAAGYVTKIRLGVGAGSYSPNVPTKVALLNASGTVLSSGTGTISASSDYGVIAISSVHASAGSYSIAVFANSNAEPPAALLTGQPANSAYYSFGTYSSWPGSTVTADGGSTVKYAVGLRLAPDDIPPTFRVKRGAIRRR